METSCQMLTLGVILSRRAQDIIKASEPVTRYESRVIENLEEIRLNFNKVKRGIQSCQMAHEKRRG